MSEAPAVNWPARPEPLGRSDDVDWHVTFKVRGDGGLILYCNEKPFCILRRSKQGDDHWIVPGFGTATSRLQAMQKAGEAFLGEESKWKTLVTA